MRLAEELRFGPGGLVPAVLQDHESLEVLIVAFMNAEAVERTQDTGLVHLWSRSRQELWLKGETSGRLQHVVEIRPNCEMDSLLVLVCQDLPGACHTGHSSCYYRRVTAQGLEETSPPLFDPKRIYRDLPSVESVRELLDAYAWLRDQPVVPESGTSRLLHGEGPDPLSRLREEWEEFFGVLDGTHVHSGFDEDALLELYQALYWTCMYQVLHGLGDADAAHAQLTDGYNSGVDPRQALAQALGSENTSEQLRGLWYSWGSGCRAAGLRAAAAVERDLDELRAKPYMVAYFKGGGPAAA